MQYIWLICDGMRSADIAQWLQVDVFLYFAEDIVDLHFLLLLYSGFD